MKDRRTLLTLAGSTTLIALNWLTFIWAVASGQLLQASLGYYINPLVNVLLGFVFLSERLRPWQWASFALAATGVAFLAVSYGGFPWVALVLAFSFAFYGLLRKVARLDSLSGLTMETMLLFPVMLGYWCRLLARGDSAMTTGPLHVQVLLPLGGVITAVPLLWFAGAARRLRLSTIGFMQYIAPTFQFLLAVVAFGEPFTRAHAISFALIWVALSIYTTDTLRASRSRRTAPSAK
jgi:chloramphenicol-sensitive protein RarD